MIYPFECPKCSCYHEHICGVDAKPETIKCPECNEDMKRIITASQIIVPKEFVALGKKMTSQSDVKEEINKIHGETGREMIPLGDQKLVNTAPKRHDLSKLVDDLAADGVFDNVDSAKKSIYDD